jgi:hypothetical protein
MRHERRWHALNFQAQRSSAIEGGEKRCAVVFLAIGFAAFSPASKSNELPRQRPLRSLPGEGSPSPLFSGKVEWNCGQPLADRLY